MAQNCSFLSLGTKLNFNEKKSQAFVQGPDRELASRFCSVLNLYVLVFECIRMFYGITAIQICNGIRFVHFQIDQEN